MEKIARRGVQVAGADDIGAHEPGATMRAREIAQTVTILIKTFATMCWPAGPALAVASYGPVVPGTQWQALATWQS